MKKKRKKRAQHKNLCNIEIRPKLSTIKKKSHIASICNYMRIFFFYSTFCQYFGVIRKSSFFGKNIYFLKKKLCTNYKIDSLRINECWKDHKQ